jgi:hypothetical protein
VKERWQRRAADYFELRDPRYEYASRRVASLDRDITPKLRGCNRVVFPLACRCPSSRSWGVYTCRQTWLCSVCRKARARKIAGKVEAALEARVIAEQERARAGAFGFGGFRSDIRIVLVTLTVKHSGDVDADRTRILEGWQNVRKRYHDEWGKFPSVLVWEVTPGTDGLGHVHAHVACVWPWRDYGRIGRWWYAGTHGGRDPGTNNRTSRINFGSGFRTKNQPRNVPKQPTTPRSMARYLAKYLSKGADSSAFSDELTARVSAAFYNQRSIVTSHRFWLPRDLICPCCGVQKTRARGLASEWMDRPFDLPPDDTPDWIIDTWDNLSDWRSTWSKQ